MSATNAAPSTAASSGGVSDDAPPGGGIFAVDYDGRAVAVVRAATAADAVERTVSMVDCSCRERLVPRRLAAREAAEAELDRWRRYEHDHLLDCPVAAAAEVLPAPAMRRPPVGFPGAARRRDRQRRNARTIALAVVGIACFTAAGMAAVGAVSGYFDDGARSAPTQETLNRKAGRSDGAPAAEPAGTPPRIDAGSTPPPPNNSATPDGGLPTPPSPSGGDGGPSGPAPSSAGGGIAGQSGGRANAPPPLVLRGSSDADTGDGPQVVVPPPGRPLIIGQGASLGDFGTGRAGLPPRIAPDSGVTTPQIASLPPLPAGNLPGGTTGNGKKSDGSSPGKGGPGGTDGPVAGGLPPGGTTPPETTTPTGNPPGSGPSGPVLAGDPPAPGGPGQPGGGPGGNTAPKGPPPGKPGTPGGSDAPATTDDPLKIDEPPAWPALALAILVLAVALRERRRHT